MISRIQTLTHTAAPFPFIEEENQRRMFPTLLLPATTRKILQQLAAQVLFCERPGRETSGKACHRRT
jgi:hypothetical protein